MFYFYFINHKSLCGGKCVRILELFTLVVITEVEGDNAALAEHGWFVIAEILLELLIDVVSSYGSQGLGTLVSYLQKMNN